MISTKKEDLTDLSIIKDDFGKREWIYSLLVILFISGQVWFDLKMPDYMSEITRLVQTQGSQMKTIITQGVFMLICAFASLTCNIVSNYFSSKVSSLYQIYTGL